MPLHDPISLLAVGDICPGDCCCMGFGVGTLGRTYGPAFHFSKIASVFQRGDIVFGNCEGVLSTIGANPKDADSMSFRGDPSFAKMLRDVGFTVMSVANNHVGEHGLDAMHDTFRNLEDAGIDTIGQRGTNRISRPLVQNVKGLKVGWLGYAEIPSKNSHQDYRALAFPGSFDMAREAERLKQEVDFLIVSAHWGNEYLLVPPRRVIEEAHALADAGADLVLGHHPHVLQGVEWHGSCYIVYSLGNFLFDDWQKRLRDSAVFQCSIESGKVVNPRFLPITMNEQFQPEVADSSAAVRILKRVEKSSCLIRQYEVYSPSDADGLKQEQAMKRRMVWENLMFSIRNLGKMGPRVAYQKLRHRLTFLPSWT